MKKRDADVKQLMAEETSRGRRRPVRAVDLDRRRLVRKMAELLADKNCDKRFLQTVLREDFGLKDESPTFQMCVKLWDDQRGD